MTQDLIDSLRSRINPAYAAQMGTESHERRLCVEALEKLLADSRRYQWLRARIPGGTYRIIGVIYSDGGDGVDAAIDAAMAADNA